MPYLGILHKIAQADIFIIVDHVQYARKTFQNRTYIKVGGKPLLLTIPVLSKGKYEAPINEIEIDNRSPWKKKHLKSIHLGYSKAPFFAPYIERIEAIYQREHTVLSEFTSELLVFFLKEFELVKDIRYSSSMQITGKKTELLIDLVRAVGGDVYVSGPGARNYFDEALYAESGFGHRFDAFQHPQYPQQGNEFLEGMACLDLLFNCGKDGRRYITG